MSPAASTISCIHSRKPGSALWAPWHPVLASNGLLPPFSLGPHPLSPLLTPGWELCPCQSWLAVLHHGHTRHTQFPPGPGIDCLCWHSAPCRCPWAQSRPRRVQGVEGEGIPGCAEQPCDMARHTALWAVAVCVTSPFYPLTSRYHSTCPSLNCPNLFFFPSLDSSLNALQVYLSPTPQAASLFLWEMSWGAAPSRAWWGSTPGQWGQWLLWAGPGHGVHSMVWIPCFSASVLLWPHGAGPEMSWWFHRWIYEENPGRTLKSIIWAPPSNFLFELLCGCADKLFSHDLTV